MFQERPRPDLNYPNMDEDMSVLKLMTLKRDQFFFYYWYDIVSGKEDIERVYHTKAEEIILSHQVIS
jgi:hypothetical protein